MKAISYTLTIESKGSYLHATVQGENGRETVLAYFEEIRAACVARDCYRVLIEERLTGPRFPLEELYQLATELSTRAGPTYEALAYVDVNAEGDTIQQVVSMVVDPGSATGVFATVAEAERWLRAKEQGPPVDRADR
ncbi:MAG TPA: hypothetical protein VFI13_04885, partial [Gemmatimonadales bacterium]|nr:hypothetical protein [Gemmatimonadales bacterium]